MPRIGAIILFVAVCFGCANYRDAVSDFIERSVFVDGKEYRFRVLLPKNRDPNKKVAVMLFLHGSSARGDDNLAQVDVFRWAIDPLKDKVDFIAVLPQCRPDTFWAAQDIADYALAALDQSVEEFNGDPQRLYLVGFSLGGYGVWQIAAGNPGKFAALVPVAGGIVEHPIRPPGRTAIIASVGEMRDSSEPYKEVAKAIGQTPVWIFHGGRDHDVPFQFSRSIVEALKVKGRTDVRYTEYPDDEHQIFGKSFGEPGFLTWLAEQKLNNGK